MAPAFSQRPEAIGTRANGAMDASIMAAAELPLAATCLRAQNEEGKDSDSGAGAERAAAKRCTLRLLNGLEVTFARANLLRNQRTEAERACRR